MSSSSSERHHRAARDAGPIGLAIVTVSDTRTAETDANGAYLRERVESAGHHLVAYGIVRDEPAEVRAALDAMLLAGGRIILFNGGTGIAARDTTYDALSALLEKQLPGFGELFRMLSWEQVGAAAMLSRAVAGTYRGALVFSMPGSPAAVRLAWERLIAPELAHLAWEMER